MLKDKRILSHRKKQSSKLFNAIMSYPRLCQPHGDAITHTTTAAPLLKEQFTYKLQLKTAERSAPKAKRESASTRILSLRVYSNSTSIIIQDKLHSHQHPAPPAVHYNHSNWVQ